MSDCMNPPAVIPRSDADPEVAALFAELKRRYPNDEHLSVYRQLRSDGSTHLQISIGSFENNQRRTYSLGTDTADRALCCVAEWEKSLADSSAAPPKIHVAYCCRCGDPLGASLPGYARIDLHSLGCRKCPKGTRVEISEYGLLERDT